MALVEALSVFIVAFTSFAYGGQVDLVPTSLPVQQSALGVFDGQVVQRDATVVPARRQLSQFGQVGLVPTSQPVQESPFGFFGGQVFQTDATVIPARGQLRQFGIGQQVPISPRFGAGQLPGVFGQSFGPRFPNARDLFQCPRNRCFAQFIPRRCRYTPVLIGPRGNYCLGCPENICPRTGQPGGQRERRLRRRLCRVLGICLGGAQIV